MMTPCVQKENVYVRDLLITSWTFRQFGDSEIDEGVFA